MSTPSGTAARPARRPPTTATLTTTPPPPSVAPPAREHIRGSSFSQVERARRIRHQYTHNGSRLTRAPDDLWARVSAFYHNNRHNWMREEWNPTTVRPFVNFWEVPFLRDPLPRSLYRDPFYVIPSSSSGRCPSCATPLPFYSIPFAIPLRDSFRCHST